MSSYGFDSLKHINLSMLNNLFYACICRTIYPCSWLTITVNILNLSSLGEVFNVYHNNIWDTFKLFHLIVNLILTRKQQQLVHNQFFASTFQPYSWVLPRSLWRLELCGRLASTLIEIIGMFWRELLPLPSILSGKRSEK